MKKGFPFRGFNAAREIFFRKIGKSLQVFKKKLSYIGERPFRSRKGGIPTKSDAEILDLYLQRSEYAIMETDAKYGKYLYAIAFNILHDAGDSEECLNDAYLGIWNAIPPNKPAVMLPFLSKIVRHISINRYKKRCREKRIPSEYTVSLSELEDCLGADDSIESDRLGGLISDYLRTLSERRRCIFICRYYCSDSIKTIADMTGLSESSVYKELAHIRGGLKNYLEKEDITL